jgi:hypothetical protein
MDELWGGSGPPGPPPYLRHCLSITLQVANATETTGILARRRQLTKKSNDLSTNGYLLRLLRVTRNILSVSLFVFKN